MRQLIALVLMLGLTAPAFGMEPWDGLRPGVERYETGPDHPLSGVQSSVGHTLVVAGVPVVKAMMSAGTLTVQEEALAELLPFWFVPYGIVVGTWLETRSAPSKVGKFEYNWHDVLGESAKWERDPDHIGWNRLVRYDTFGPGKAVVVPVGGRKYVHEVTGSVFDRVGS